MSIGVEPAFVNCACNLHPNEKKCGPMCHWWSISLFFLVFKILLSCCHLFVIATLDNNTWHMSPLKKKKKSLNKSLQKYSLEKSFQNHVRRKKEKQLCTFYEIALHFTCYWNTHHNVGPFLHHKRMSVNHAWHRWIQSRQKKTEESEERKHQM
jgi:hypothetical protein